MKSSEIRDQFIQFFKDKHHYEIKSSPVVPIDDPTLLFINAGMNQFKDIFLGRKEPSHKRVVNSQKCIRAGGKHNDLDEVGKDGLHHTFFEMLGNWSFGDYYKKEAVVWAWELLTGKWGLDKKKLYATVHHTDKEAYEIWHNDTDIESSHIEYHGDKDNFWEMGDYGPCGPCSEIHIDLGEDICELKDKNGHVCKVNGECNRFIELWNLVFIQYNREKNGELNNLGNHYVDTGAGFERLCMVLQNKKSNYETDLFVPIINKIKELTEADWDHQDNKTSCLVVADHIRTLCIAIADGGYPSNEGRGYVLRRILRRAARYGRLIGFDKPFLYELVTTVSCSLGNYFSEIKEKESYLKTIIKAEEERFNQTLDKGLVKFAEIVAQMKSNQIDGKLVFLLYDTYGFPPDLTAILADEKGLSIDEDGFNVEMEKQRKMARESSSFKMDESNDNWVFLNRDSNVNGTEFVGYQIHNTECKIIQYSLFSSPNYCKDIRPHINEQEVKIVIDKTPFYAESGGQIADKGYILNEKSKVQIYDVKKEGDLLVHYGKIIQGELTNDTYTAIVDNEYRLSVERNHTVTHLLHTALREVLGEHVQQKGSLVAAEYLRFDFSHFKGLKQRDIQIIEDMVNTKIKAAMPITTEKTTYDKAKQSGAMALFGEKYGDEVRTVKISDYSLELCGGTHLRNTGEAGLFKITGESAVASGVRRIEAVTGVFTEEYVKKLQEQISTISEKLNVPVNQISDKISRIVEESIKMNKELQSLKMKSAGSELDRMLNEKVTVEGVPIIKGIINADDNNALRNTGDTLKEKMTSGVGVLGTVIDDKVALLVIVSNDLTTRLRAGVIVSKVAEIVGGKGGGRNDMAMAGGKHPEKLSEAINSVESIIKEMLNNQ